MRQLYVMSEAPNSDYPDNYLIGILTENNGEYSFQYAFKDEFPKHYLKIHEFPEMNKIYNNIETKSFVKRIVPAKDYIYIKKALETANLLEYDEWELLKFYGLRSQSNARLYETLPEGAITYDQNS